MASKSGPRKKSGSTRSGDAGDKDRLIAELKGRIATLEYELRLKREDGTSQDSAGRRRAGEAPRKNEARLRAVEAAEAERRRFFNVLETLPAMVCLLTPDYHVPFANRSFREKFGESHGRRCYEYCFGLGEPCGFCEAYTVLKTGQPHHWEVKGPDGSLIDVYDFPFTDVDGSPMILEMDIDITERKRTEEALKAAKQQAELYLDLMSHDINNMHQIAMGYLELAQDSIQDEGERKLLEKPVEVLQRSARLIQNVRKLQKLKDGVFRIGNVDIRGVLVDVQREYGAIPEKNITLQFHGHEHCYVMANELLHDVFANLVSNAVKHSNALAEIGIDVDRVSDNGTACYRVAVEDNGSGIPDGSKDMIFNRMQKGSAKGMGLGLFLVRSLVESYGGRVWVEDRVKGDHTKGARFVVVLPAVDR